MNIDPATLDAQYERASHDWPFIDHVTIVWALPPFLLYAVGSRETNLTNEVGDGGHGHGVWQLDDRSHTIAAGFDGDVPAQCAVAGAMLHSLLATFGGNLRAALAAYNAGAGTVQYNLANGLDVDTGTAHGDYSQDVVARAAWLQSQHFPNTESDDDMPKDLIVSYHGAQWIVAHDLTSRVGLHRPEDASALHGTGQYESLDLTDATMASIPVVAAPPPPAPA